MLTEYLAGDGDSTRGVSLPMDRVGDHILRVAVSTDQAQTFGNSFLGHLATTVRTIREDESIRAVILVGGSTYFSAGASKA